MIFPKKHFVALTTILVLATASSPLPAQNPLDFGSSIRTADPSGHVWPDGKMYLYTSHDEECQPDFFMKDWHAFSSDDLVNWTAHGAILSVNDLAWADNYAWAPDAAYKNGKYYLVFPAGTGDKDRENPENSDKWMGIGIAVSDSPTGPFEDAIGAPLWTEPYANDPNLFIDDDGKAYLYFHGRDFDYHVVEMAKDLLSTKGDFQKMDMGGYEPKMEGPWVFKRGGLYYFTMPENNRELSYYTAETPKGPWTHQGVFMEQEHQSNNHHSIVEYKGHWILFYHRWIETPESGCTLQERQRHVTAEYLHFNEDGTIRPVERTEEGVGDFPTKLQASAGIDSAADDDWAMADKIVATIEAPRIPDRDFYVTDYGAAPNDAADDRDAILAAIAAATDAGGGRVILPEGAWISNGPVVLKSRINLHVAQGARLTFGTRAADYLPVVETRWEGTIMMGYSPLIYAAGVEDVAITGPGIIDGNANSEFHTWNSEKYEPRLPHDDMMKLRRMGFVGTPAEKRVFGEGTHLRPSAIQFFGARRILLDGYTILNSPFWVNHLVFTDHAIVRNLKVDSHFGNNDGVDIDSSTYVLIEDNHFRTGDDSVVVKSGRDKDGRDVGRPSEYVVVRNNDMGGEDGIALGSEMSGGIRYVFFDNNILRKGSAAIRFKSNLDRGGVVEHIRVRNFTVEEFDTLFWFELNYPSKMGGNFPATYRDIVFENFRVEKVGVVFEAHAPAAAPLLDVRLEDIRIGEAETPLVLENVSNLSLENVTIGDQVVRGMLDWRKE